MSATKIPARLKRLVTVRARRRCEYCLSPADPTGIWMTVDHIFPRVKRGATEEGNLCLACVRCNTYKGSRAQARDPKTDRQVRLFHPHRQRWAQHFRWSDEGTRIVGLTACGRATVEALQMNYEDMVRARKNWVRAGWHPPKEEKPQRKKR